MVLSDEDDARNCVASARVPRSGYADDLVPSRPGIYTEPEVVGRAKATIASATAVAAVSGGVWPVPFGYSPRRFVIVEKVNTV